MIAKHVDIWAVLLLLFGFALFTRANETVVRIAKAKMILLQGLPQSQVRISPFRLNRFGRQPSSHAPAPCRLI
jgi:hypothetical protein